MPTTFRALLVPEPGMDDVCKLAIEGRVTYREAPELRKAILGEMSRVKASNLVVELGGVERMDVAGLAVLVECLMLSQKQGLRMILCGPSESVLQIFRLAGPGGDPSRVGMMTASLAAPRPAPPRSASGPRKDF